MPFLDASERTVNPTVEIPFAAIMTFLLDERTDNEQKRVSNVRESDAMGKRAGMRARPHGIAGC